MILKLHFQFSLYVFNTYNQRLQYLFPFYVQAGPNLTPWSSKKKKKKRPTMWEILFV